MALPPAGIPIEVGDLIYLTIITYDPDTEQLGLNTMHFNVESKTGGPVIELEAAAHFDSLIEVPYKTVLAVDASYFGCGVRNLTGAFPKPTYVFSANQGPGMVAVTTSDNQLCALATLTSNSGGPGGRGRQYYAFVPTSFLNDDNEITNASVLLYQDLMNAYVDTLIIPNAGATGSITVRPVLYNRDTEVITYMTGKRIRKGVATQRRRSFYGQPNFLPT